jgi:hypothetical protein
VPGQQRRLAALWTMRRGPRTLPEARTPDGAPPRRRRARCGFADDGGLLCSTAHGRIARYATTVTYPRM